MTPQHAGTAARCNRSRLASTSTFNMLAFAVRLVSLMLVTQGRYETFAVQARISGAIYPNQDAGEDVYASLNTSSPHIVDRSFGGTSRKTGDHMVNVIIGFKDGTTSRIADQPGLEVTHQFTHVNAEAVRMSRNDLMSLSDNPDIEFVEEDGVMYLYAETVPWGIPAIQADVTTTPPPDTGNLRPGEECFHICVVDSGFYAKHIDLVSMPRLP
jgi:hypothetical protein